MNDINQEIVDELKYVKSLLGMIFTKEMESNKEKIIFLSRFGFSPTELAELLDTTSGSVSVTLSVEKKQRLGSASDGKSRKSKKKAVENESATNKS